MRLEQGIAFERISRFGDVAMAVYVGQAQYLELRVKDAADFLQLMRVVGGKDQFS